VAIEYFMKWVEAKPLMNVTSTSIRNFFRQNIICRYGVPHHIIVNNAKYFDSAMFKDSCQKIGTKVAFMSVYHPQTNGAVERVNELIFEAIKKYSRVKIKANGRRLCRKQYGATTLQYADQ
jgi:hypothetical protein